METRSPCPFGRRNSPENAGTESTNQLNSESTEQLNWLKYRLHEFKTAGSDRRITSTITANSANGASLAEWKWIQPKKKAKVCLDINRPSHGRTLMATEALTSRASDESVTLLAGYNSGNSWTVPPIRLSRIGMTARLTAPSRIQWAAFVQFPKSRPKFWHQRTLSTTPVSHQIETERLGIGKPSPDGQPNALVWLDALAVKAR